MNENDISAIFRSLRVETCDIFISLAASNIDVVGDMGRSLLHEAIAYSKIASAYALIDLGAKPDAKDDLGRTPVHYAAMFNQVEVMSKLIASGGDVNALDNYGNNPLWTAILNPNIDYTIIIALTYAGSNSTKKNKSGKSAKDMAIMINDLNMIKILEDFNDQ